MNCVYICQCQWNCVWVLCEYRVFFDIYLTEALRSIHSTCCQHEIPSFCLISIARTFYLCGLHFGRHFARTHKKYYTFAKCEPPQLSFCLSSTLCSYICMWIIFSHRHGTPFSIFLFDRLKYIYLNVSSSTDLGISFHFSLGWGFFQIAQHQNQIALGYWTFQVYMFDSIRRNKMANIGYAVVLEQ